jgi:hypothetical protein
MRSLAAPALLLLMAALEAGADPIEIATPCRAREPRLAGAGEGALLLWQEGAGAADAKKGCRGETRAAWISGGAAKPLPPDFLGAGFRAAESEARATELTNGKLLVVWSEKGATIEAAIFAAGAEVPEQRFTVTPEDAPSSVAAPRPLAKAGEAFLVVYESDFFSGRRRNLVRREFEAAGKPSGDPAPSFPDFIAVNQPLAARTTAGFATGGPGLGPLGEGFFLQFWDEAGDQLGEPIAIGEKQKVLGGNLAAVGETYVFTWNIRAGKEEKAFLRLYGSNGQPKAPARELGQVAGTPSLDANLLVFLDAEHRIQVLTVDPSKEEQNEQGQGPSVAPGTTELAVDATRRLVAWAEEKSLLVAPLP